MPKKRLTDEQLLARDEERIAKRRAKVEARKAREASKNVRELERYISMLNKLAYDHGEATSLGVTIAALNDDLTAARSAALLPEAKEP